MKIISGKLKGLNFPKFNGKNTRPTSNKSKESLFNTLSNIVEFEKLKVLDLYAGLGNVSLEFISRDSLKVVSVEINQKNIEYLKKIKNENQISNWLFIKKDVIKFCKNEDLSDFDLIFADPPYKDTNIFELIDIITKKIENQEKSCLFVVEHESKMMINNPLIFNQKDLGDSKFSYFKNK